MHAQPCANMLFFLPDTVTWTMIHYLLITLPTAGTIGEHQLIYLNSAISKKMQALQTRTVNAVEDSAVSEYFLWPGSNTLLILRHGKI